MQLGLLSPLHLKKLFELMGTTYIKLGQFIICANFFPARICQKIFRTLQQSSSSSV
uniref:Uncharacterized protein n=1 Tax=Brassica oleracea TaxID=3712 RepID=A0A3P6E2W1_BRAOL|nr:unnamed protein product [Brassica oleracea]